MAGGLECGVDVLVNIDHEVLLGNHFLITGLNSLHNPVLERLAKHTVGNVDDELPRQPSSLFLDWKVRVHLRLLTKIFHQVIHRQVLIKRHRKMHDLLALYKLERD